MNVNLTTSAVADAVLGAVAILAVGGIFTCIHDLRMAGEWQAIMNAVANGVLVFGLGMVGYKATR